MQEQEINGLKTLHHKEVFASSSKFRNVVEKIRNPRLGQSMAWSEFQPVLSYLVEDYPEKFSSLDEVLREIFTIRRQAFFDINSRETASKDIRLLIGSLTEEAQDQLDAPMVCIRDLFDVEPPKKKPRSF